MEGVQVSQEIKDLREGLSDTVKAVAQELDMKTSVLNKAIRVAHKAEFIMLTYLMCSTKFLIFCMKFQILFL